MLAAVVPTWHGGALVAACVAALRAQSRPPDVVVVVRSNPAPVPLPAGVVVVDPGRRVHYGEAINLGAATVPDADVLFLNDDTVPSPGFVAALLAAAAATPGAILQPRILLAGGDTVDNAGHHLFPDGLTWARGRGRPAESVADPATVGAISGAAFYVPRPVLDRVGGFDTTLGPYAEDLDFSLRAVRCGIALRYVPEARVHHVLGASYGRTGPEKLYRIERNRVRAAVRSLPAAVLPVLPALTVVRWGVLAAAGAVGRGDPAVEVGLRGALAAAAGSVAGWAHLPDALRKRRNDATTWTTGERAMWAHVWRHRVRVGDVVGG